MNKHIGANMLVNSSLLSDSSVRGRQVLEKCRDIVNKDPIGRIEHWNGEKKKLFELIKDLFRSEVIALFVVEDQEVVLDIQDGYKENGVIPISDERLRDSLIYKITPSDRWGLEPFDGITGLVASRGEEFSADSREEIESNYHHQGKPNILNIWSDKRPFRNMFAIPLKKGDRVIGVLKVENKNASGGSSPFTSDDKDALRAIGQLISFIVAQAQDENAFSIGSNCKDVVESAKIRKIPFGFKDLADQYDQSKMEKVIEGVPKQIEYALRDLEFPDINYGSFQRAVVIGMGGSAFGRDVIVEAFPEEIGFGSLVSWKRYEPPLVHDGIPSLFIASSFSGNTEETLSAMERLPQGSAIVVLTAGGKLAEIAQERRLPLIRIPAEKEDPNFQPRSALGYFVVYMARILHAIKLFPDKHTEFDSLTRFLKNHSFRLRKEAEDVAVWLETKIPVIYTDDQYERSIGRITKIRINENAKRPAFSNILPEANHNEMIGFSRPYGLIRFSGPYGSFGFLYLKDPASNDRVHRRFEAMSEIFGSEEYQHIALRTWRIPGQSKLEKIFAALTFADWCSYSLALLDGVDPTPVKLVEEFKSLIKKPRPYAHDFLK